MFGRLCRKVFQQGSGYRGEEVDVCWRIQASRKIGGNDLEVLGSRLHEIDDRDVRNRMARRVNVAACVHQLQLSSRPLKAARGGGSVATYRCIVTPQLRRSFTRRTLLMTSLPKLSNTSTFHIGWPLASRIGVDFGNRPFALGSWCSSAFCSEVWFKLRIFSIEATRNISSRRSFARAEGGRAYRLACPSSCGGRTRSPSCWLMKSVRGALAGKQSYLMRRRRKKQQAALWTVATRVWQHCRLTT